MTLKHPYNVLFYRRILRKKKLWDILEDLDSRITSNTSGDSTVADKVSTLETTVGKASGTGAGGLAKDVSDMKTVIGKASGDGAGGIAKDVSDMKTVIGSADDEGSIIARIIALENAADDGYQQGD